MHKCYLHIDLHRALEAKADHLTISQGLSWIPCAI